MSRIARITIILASLIVYPLMFFASHPVAGDISGMWAILPVVVGGWISGIGLGLVLGMLSIPSSVALYTLVRSPDANHVPLYVAGGIGCMVLGAGAGWLRNLLDQANDSARRLEEERATLRAENANRRIVEEELRQAKDSLGVTVAERTREMRELNQALQIELAERRRAEQAVRASEDRYRQLYEEAPIAYYSVNAEDARIRISNRRLSEMLGYAEVLTGHTFLDLYADTPAGKEAARKIFERMRSGEETHDAQVQMCKSDGSVVWTSVTVRPVRDENGRIVFSRATALDITERKQAEQQMLHNALHDPLTGLPNRVLFMDRLGGALGRTRRRTEYLFAVLYLDFDRFKVVNDSLGHPIGDQLLVESARRLEACVRSVDTVARLGGDEFVVLLDDVLAVDDAVQIADRIQNHIAKPYDLDGHRVFISASMGIVFSSIGYEHSEDVLRDGDIAMYRAKGLGRGRYEVFDVGMRDRAMSLLELETDLRQAVDKKELILHYQPIYALAESRLTGFEALVRWQHPGRGLVAPAEFIPIAEESGAILEIGRWVLTEACRQMRVWQLEFPADPPLTISVNLSVKQLGEPDLVLQVAQILKETGLEARLLKLEITESMFVKDAESTHSVLLQLRELGVEVQIDDFGTGYSSLGYLHTFPIDTLKIDRTFIGRIGKNGNGSEIVQSILSLAHDLGMQVVAEGVETLNQLNKLKTLKCEYAQGFLFARPVDSQTATALLAQSPAADAGIARQEHPR
ncbi:MAG: EAL domain-containing protein [Chloroflexi bacterium]|nr:EAL domain-containing protein [Chloroflexota bacterium]